MSAVCWLVSRFVCHEFQKAQEVTPPCSNLALFQFSSWSTESFSVLVNRKFLNLNNILCRTREANQIRMQTDCRVQVIFQIYRLNVIVNNNMYLHCYGSWNVLGSYNGTNTSYTKFEISWFLFQFKVKC